MNDEDFKIELKYAKNFNHDNAIYYETNEYIDWFDKTSTVVYEVNREYLEVFQKFILPF